MRRIARFLGMCVQNSHQRDTCAIHAYAGVLAAPAGGSSCEFKPEDVLTAKGHQQWESLCQPPEH